MKEKISVTVILGTAREGRVSEKIAKAVLEKVCQDEMVSLTLVDVKEYLLGKTVKPEVESKIAAPWREIAEKSDGFVLVVPEYNHGYPGEFKMLIDSVKNTSFDRKPALLVTVSNGPWGGARMGENLKPILQDIGLIVLPAVVHTSFADKKFKEDGVLNPEYAKQLNTLLDKLVQYTRELKSLRGV